MTKDELRALSPEMRHQIYIALFWTYVGIKNEKAAEDYRLFLKDLRELWGLSTKDVAALEVRALRSKGSPEMKVELVDAVN